MNRLFGCEHVIGILIVLVISSGAIAEPSNRPTLSLGGDTIHGGPAGGSSLSKTTVDTTLLMGPEGSGAPYIGDFERGWNGWTTIDETQPTESHWQVSDYNQAVPGDLAAWCGDISFATCNDSLDVAGGYGNDWHELLEFKYIVPDPGLSTTVRIQADLQYDTEPGYDFVSLSYLHNGNFQYQDVWSLDGRGQVQVDETISYLPGEYWDGNSVRVFIRFESDAAWSDADCSWPTEGALQIDDIQVDVSNGAEVHSTVSDFQDGTFGEWEKGFPWGVGNFGQRWRGLKDADPCRQNNTVQVAFINDGLVVPELESSPCINWCYGPNGYIVSTTGGRLGWYNPLLNSVESPPMSAAGSIGDGIAIAFDVYRHEDLSFDSPWLFYRWMVRTADTDNSAGHGVQVLSEQPYLSRNFVFYGGPEYLRMEEDVSDLANPEWDQIQVMLDIYQHPGDYWWVDHGHDGYPAPYFDNVSVRSFPIHGPALIAREALLANDNFPEIDSLNVEDLGLLSVRFDMANNIALGSHQRNDPGDSIVVEVAAVRQGAALNGAPELHYLIYTNPLFDAYRIVPASGMTVGVRIPDESYLTGPNDWSFDLPDTGLLFPGDVLHYYVTAADEVGGDIRWAILPADTTGFGDFSISRPYDSRFVVHALPTLADDGTGALTAPPTLFWNDASGRNAAGHWMGALLNRGFVPGVDFDIYRTAEPSRGVGNGIGGRTSGASLEMYENLLYSAGNLGVNTISNGDFNNDAGDDILALETWLSLGNRNLFLTGDDLVADLGFNAGAAGSNFLTTVLGVDLSTHNIRSMISDQTTPLIAVVPGNSVFFSVDSWIAYGACPTAREFDGVTVVGAAQRLAEFTNPGGASGAYPYSAGTLNIHGGTNRIISLPYDLANIMSVPGEKQAAPMPRRAQVLGEVLDFFGLTGNGLPSAVETLPVRNLQVINHPNPFNPSTRIDFLIKAPGLMTLKVFDVSGRLVKTLIDDVVDDDGYRTWDGTNNAGGEVASGVYFYEARNGGAVEIGKMTLVK